MAGLAWLGIPLVFGLSLALVLGAYALFIVRPERRVLDRLRPRVEVTKVRKGVLKQEPKPPSSAVLNALLARLGPLTGPVKLLIEQAGSSQTVEGFFIRSAMLALAGGVITTWFAGPVIGLAVGACMGAIPAILLRRTRAKRILKFEEQFPEAIDLISRALRAGHALPTGLGMVADEMPAPVGREFRIVFDEQNFGLTMTTALRNFAQRVPVLDARFFVVAVLTQRESGGNLSEVLDNLSTVIRERFKVKRQVRVISAHGRITGTVLTLMPPVLGVLTALVSGGETFRTLINDPLGQKMIYMAVSLQVLGTLAIRKIVNIEY